MSVVVEPMRVTDAPRCAELERLLFPTDDPWTAEAFRAELAAPHTRYVLVRDHGGTAIGYAGVALLGLPGASGEAEVHTIGVDPTHHRGGIGSALLAALLEIADAHGPTVFLDVRTDNEAALALYRREGFVVVGIRRRYYHPSGADAFTMVRRRTTMPSTTPGEERGL